uniref:Galactokinase n=1 Tax=Meloidogyne hapla TaxID=6305 RepID=A0A1I8BMT9_MELHA
MSCEECANLYKQKFGLNPEWLIRCPGRVNLIGEHIDYSHYPVLPMAIEDSTWVAAGSSTTIKNGTTKEIRLENANPRYRLKTENNKLQRFIHFSSFTLEIGNSFSNALANGSSPQWYHYFFAGWRGALERLYKPDGDENEDKALEQAKGMFVLVGSRIPPSAGLSSSSALVCAAALATLCVQTGQAFGKISKKDLAEFSTKSERFVGVEGGGMDQACECGFNFYLLLPHNLEINKGSISGTIRSIHLTKASKIPFTSIFNYKTYNINTNYIQQ